MSASCGRVGAVPDPARLDDVARLVLGPLDRLYAADRRTASIHVFEPDGRPAFVCRTEPSEFADESWQKPWFTVDGAGEVRLFCWNAHGFLRYGPDGVRLGVLPLAAEDSHVRLPQPGTGRSWVLGGESLRLVGPDGDAVRSLERTPDDRWLRRLDGAGVAPDGSLALVALGGMHASRRWRAGGSSTCPRATGTPAGVAFALAEPRAG
jgi:hypothetical protein